MDIKEENFKKWQREEQRKDFEREQMQKQTTYIEKNNPRLVKLYNNFSVIYWILFALNIAFLFVPIDSLPRLTMRLIVIFFFGSVIGYYAYKISGKKWESLAAFLGWVQIFGPLLWLLGYFWVRSSYKKIIQNQLGSTRKS